MTQNQIIVALYKNWLATCIFIVVISSDKILKFTLILFIIKVYISACKIIIIAVQFTLLIINEKRQCDEIDKLLK